MSLVFVAFRHKYDVSLHSTKLFNTRPWPTSSLNNRLSKAVSTENLIKYLLGRVPLQSFVYNIMIKRGDKTHPWGEPMETTFTLEMVLFTCWSPPPKTSSTNSANSDSSLSSEFIILFKQLVRLQRIKGRAHIHVENSGTGFGFLKMTEYEVY